MVEPFTRRDFLNGVLVASGGTLLDGRSPRDFLVAADWTGYGGVGEYRHSNGDTAETMEAGHGLRARLYDRLPAETVETGEVYDLVVVGGGLSGLAAAMEFQTRRPDRQRSCLVLDNHAIFGGEAKQNQFLVDGKRLTAHQGSAVFWVPARGGLTERFYQRMGLDRFTFDYQKWGGKDPEIPLGQTPYDLLGSQGQNYGFFFGARFGQEPGSWLIDPWAKKLDGAPLPAETRADLLRWRHPDPALRARFPRPAKEGDEISRRLDRITWEDHIMERSGVSRDTIRGFLAPVEGGGYGIGPDVLSAYCAYAAEVQHPGDGDDQRGDQMFPGGNTGLARLMVKTLVPDAISGPHSAEGVSRGLVRFGALDRPGQSTRIRLRSTVVFVAHDAPAGQSARSDVVSVAYVRGGRVHRIKARAVVMAGGGGSTKLAVRDLTTAHQEAYASFYRSPCLMANVAVRNWRFLYKLGISGCRWFEGLGNYLEVRRQATFGAPGASFSPDSPTVLTVKILYSYPGETIDVQGARGRIEMLTTSFRLYERRLRDQLSAMFGSSGFDARRDIAGIVLNRWGHAYLTPQPGFFFGRNGKPAPRDVLRGALHGRIAFANTELAGAMDHRNCFSESERAIRQIDAQVFGA